MALALSDRMRVRVWPDPEAELPVPFTVHWLFASFPADPGASGPSQAVAAPFSRYSPLPPGVYCTSQPFVSKLPRTYTQLRSL